MKTLSNSSKNETTEDFTGRVTLILANDFVAKCLFTMALQHNFYYIPTYFFNPHVMLINAYTKEFTLMNLVTFSISRSRIRKKLYFVYSLIRLYTKYLWMNW